MTTRALPLGVRVGGCQKDDDCDQSK